MEKKEENKIKLLEYLGNPNNEFLTREKLSLSVLGYAHGSGIYKYFTPDELSKIEAEALEIRRKKYSSELSKVDAALLKQAIKGDTQAAKLVYQRFEGWTEKQKLDFGLDKELLAKIEIVLVPPGKEREKDYEIIECGSNLPKKIT